MNAQTNVSTDRSGKWFVPEPSRSELSLRIEKFRSFMDENDIEVCLLTTPESIYYLTGYQTRAITSSQCLILPSSNAITLVTRRMDEGNFYRIRSATPIDEFVAIDDDQLQEGVQIAATLALQHSMRGRPVGVEPGGLFVSWLGFEAIRHCLRRETVDVGGTLAELRMIKSPWEIENHRASAAITMRAMEAGIRAVKPGTLDSEIAAAVSTSLLSSGSEWVATWPIVQTGRHTGRIHSSWRHEAVEEGSPTSIEISSAVNRYHSPLFRSVVLSGNCEQKRIAAGLSEAHLAGVAAVAPDVTAATPYLAEKAVLDAHGLSDMLKGRVGYTVGMAFSPNWVSRGGMEFMLGNDALIKPGMVFHMVTLLTRPNEFTIAHSSTVLVTDSGREVLTADNRVGPVFV